MIIKRKNVCKIFCKKKNTKKSKVTGYKPHWGQNCSIIQVTPGLNSPDFALEQGLAIRCVLRAWHCDAPRTKLRVESRRHISPPRRNSKSHPSRRAPEKCQQHLRSPKQGQVGNTTISERKADSPNITIHQGNPSSATYPRSLTHQ